MTLVTLLPPSPPPPPLPLPPAAQPYIYYYESAPLPTIAYPVSPRYLPHFHAAAAAAAASIVVCVRLAPSPTATAAAYSQFRAHHAHSHSMMTVHMRALSPVVVDTFAPIVIAASGGGGGGAGDSLQSNESMLPSPPNLLSAGSGLPAPSSLSSRCDVGINLIRWEDGSGRQWRGQGRGWHHHHRCQTRSCQDRGSLGGYTGQEGAARWRCRFTACVGAVAALSTHSL